ncbi:hypothetical protein KEM55_006055, partial [Ascosphaera atra]
AQALKNKQENAVRFEEWFNTLTPLQIKEANAARRKLYRLLGKSRPYLLPRERTVKRPMDAWKIFLKEKLKLSKPEVPIPQQVSALSKEYKSLTPEERKHYNDIAAKDYIRWWNEHIEVYGREPDGLPRARKYLDPETAKRLAEEKKEMKEQRKKEKKLERMQLKAEREQIRKQQRKEEKQRNEAKTRQEREQKKLEAREVKTG